MTTHRCNRLIGGLGFGESPRWHDGRLWFSDMQTGFVQAISPEGDLETIVRVPGYPSGIGWLPDGTALVVSMEMRCIFSIGSDGLSVYHDLSNLVPGDCNDLVVDGTGRAYVGNVGFDHRKVPFDPVPTRLVLVDQDGSHRFVGSDVLIPNGAVITPDGKALVVAETIANRLTAFTIANDGSLENRRTVIEMPGFLPDGICLDADGYVWAANSATNLCMRVSPDGSIVDQVDAGRPCYACMLGGVDGKTMFMMTADGHDEDSKARYTASIEWTEVEVPAAGWP